MRCCSFVPLYTAQNGKRQREQEDAVKSTIEAENQSHFDECLHVAMGHDCVIFNLFALVGWYWHHVLTETAGQLWLCL